MSLELRVLCRPELAAGFMLAGIPAVEAETAADAASRFRTLLADASLGVVLLEESYHRQLPEDLRRQMTRRPLPMVVPFPGIDWAARPDAAESYIVELLRQVIGYRVKLR